MADAHFKNVCRLRKLFDGSPARVLAGSNNGGRLDTRRLCEETFAAMSPTSVPASVAVDCPAKLNLHLRVGPARADGFHPLLTWMTTVGLFDRLTMRTTAGGDSAAGSPIALTCDPGNLPTDDRNLIVGMIKAWAAERLAAGQVVPAIIATLQKRTPTGAGLGGGSSDAACALLAAEALLAVAKGATPGALPPGLSGGIGATIHGPRPLPEETLMSLASRLGSDIPFFLHAPSAICTGRGEVVRAVAPPEANWALLVLPPIHMATPDVYRKFDELGLGREHDIQQQPDWDAWSKLPAAKLMDELVNDLEAPAFALRPELDEIRVRAGRKAGRTFRMSGSGSSLFTLFGDERIAAEVCDYLQIHLRPAGITPDAVKVVQVGVPVRLRAALNDE